MWSKRICFLAFHLFLSCFGKTAYSASIQSIGAYVNPCEAETISAWVKENSWRFHNLGTTANIENKGIEVKGYEAIRKYLESIDQEHLEEAKKWLLGYGEKGGDLENPSGKTGPGFFHQGQPWLGNVYYRIDTKPFFAYCLLHDHFTPKERRIVESGFLASARFRKQVMDRWNQTPNLVFKPTAMVAMAGLITGNRELLDWGFHRKGDDTHLGGYFTVMDQMLVDDGPWLEAPLYPLAHKSLWMMTQVSDLLSMTKGGDWFSRKVGDGSPRGLMDYFIDTAYPVERTGYGKGQIRIASYGDGATDVMKDLFLVNQAGEGTTAEAELGAAFAITGDRKYAAFLGLQTDYQPGGLYKPPLPEHATLPAAPSKIWPDLGLAMLRSNESTGYWFDREAIAATMLMASDYGHGHADAFSITLHGANRLLYPDYNAVQYENPAMGWTAKTIAHNTVMVDEGESRKPGTGKIRHDFGRDAKFLAVSASGVYTGVVQTRTLLLTGDYLLDVFHLSSAVPHTWDYLLHSFGRPEPVSIRGKRIENPLGGRYWRFRAAESRRTNGSWQIDFVLDGNQARRLEGVGSRLWKAGHPGQKPPENRYGDEWYTHTAAVRVTMAGAPGTEVVYGEGVQELPMLVVRRKGSADALFAATHEPWSASSPEIRQVTRLALGEGAVVVRIDAENYVDYTAVAYGPGAGEKLHVLSPPGRPETVFAFRNYGYLRLFRDGRRIAQGEWQGYRVPVPGGGSPWKGKDAGTGSSGYLSKGEIPARRDPLVDDSGDSGPAVKATPAVVRLANWDKRTVSLAIRNDTEGVMKGWVRFQPTEGISVQPDDFQFGPVAPGKSEQRTVTVSSLGAKEGKYAIPFDLEYGEGGGEISTRTVRRGLAATVGRVLVPVYRDPEAPVYRVYAERYTAELAMKHGIPTRLAGDDGRPWLDGTPLFAISAGKERVLDEATENAFTWPVEVPASLIAHARDEIRWQALFFFDRLAFRMDPDWTRFERVVFTLPGNWVKGERTPVWRRVLVPEGKGGPVVQRAVSSRPLRIEAAELGFPDRKENLCFQFLPPQEVTLGEAGMVFSIGALSGDMWTVGVCPANGLPGWRWK